MTSDNLLKFLGNREYLHQVSYQELKSMVVEYPYSLSLRYLLAMKSQQEDNTDLDRNIELLSTYGIDRSHLHRIFSEDPIVLEDLEESIIMGEDFLELKELSSLERDLADGLVVNEVNNLNFLQEKQTPVAQEIPIPSPDIALPPPPIIEPEEEIALEPLTASLEEIAPVLVGAALVADNGTIASEEKEALEVMEGALEEGVLVPTDSTLVTDIEDITKNPPITTDIPVPIEKEDSLPTEETVESIEEEKEEEEFITLDFEDEILAEASGVATIGHEEAPSASFATNEIVETEDGLPSDAIEVNDLYANPNKSVLDDALVEALFEEAEAEAVAEPAVSDSATFIENPEAILVTESEAIEEVTPPLEERDNLIASEQEIETENIVLAEVSQKIAIPSVEFEIEYSESDPITFESIQAGTDVIPLEELEVIKEDTILADEQEVAIPINTIAITAEDIGNSQPEAVKEEIFQLETPPTKIEEDSLETEVPKIETVAIAPIPKPVKATFKFDSLDQLEATFNQSIRATKPAPKIKFDSWQEQYAGVGQFSGVNVIPLINGTGKVIKRKRKVIHKEFEETVAFAEESLAMDSALVSETLAQLLVKQGQYTRARSMYEQLCLLMPKKSSFFAAEIEKIQNLPDEDS